MTKSIKEAEQSVCSSCGKDYDLDRRFTRPFCKDCRKEVFGAHKKTTYEFCCPQCGTHNVSFTKKTFCNVSCASKHRAQKNERKAGKTCSVCGIWFANIKNPRQQTCSRKCASENYKLKQRAKKAGTNSRTRNKKIEKVSSCFSETGITIGKTNYSSQMEEFLQRGGKIKLYKPHQTTSFGLKLDNLCEELGIYD